MYLRYTAATCALLFGLLNAYIIVVQAIAFGIWHPIRVAVHVAVTIAALCGAGTAFASASIRYIAAAISLTIAWQIQDIVFIVQGIVGGTWMYSQNDIGPFLLAFLPIISSVAVILADGRLQRAFKLVRQWPYQESI